MTPGAKREAVAHARSAFGLSERRACSIIGVSRRVNSYASRRPDDGALRVRLRDLASARRRFGYRRLGYLLAREGLTPNHKKLLRIEPPRDCRRLQLLSRRSHYEQDNEQIFAGGSR